MLQARIAELITPERIVPMLKASGKAGVLLVLTRLAGRQAGLNEEALLHCILQLERCSASIAALPSPTRS
jgi:hypothetical protein